MSKMDLSWLLEPQVLLGGAWAVALVVLGAVLVTVRGRLRVLYFTVGHVPVAVSNKDDAFGHIEVMLNGKAIDRLWMTTVTLTNNTGKDFEALPVRIFTRDETMMLGERTELAGTTFKIAQSPEMVKALRLEPGASPSAEQVRIARHGRDYVLPVLNRGDSAKWNILTTVKPPADGQQQLTPSAFCDLLRAGVKVRYRQIGPEVLGVPTKLAVWIGLAATVFTYGLSVWLFADAWAAALPVAAVGFLASIIGACIYKAVRFVLPVVVH